MCACVEAKRPSRTKVITVLTIPHKWIGNENVRIGVTNAAYRVSTGRCTKLEFVKFGASEHVPVIRAATAIINPKRVVYWDITTSGSTKACLSFHELAKNWKDD